MYTAPLYHRYERDQKFLRLSRQIELGIIVSPKAHLNLTLQPSDELLASDGSRFAMNRGVAIFHGEGISVEEISAENSSRMQQEYSEYTSSSPSAWLKIALMTLINRTYQTKSSIDAHRKTFEVAENGVCLAVGGGPTRSHPRVTNLNITLSPGVDVVADAHALPYRDNSVDSIVCEDVLEHLEQPWLAVAEMYRVLKPNGVLYSSTPFMICYHGYPYHFQNFTYQGHEQLYRNAGFQVLEGGTCMGPFTALLSILGFMLADLLPSMFGLRTLICRGWTVFSALVKPLDRLLQNHPRAKELAYSTYVLARK